MAVAPASMTSFIARDRRRAIAEGLRSEVLVLSGGVSAGVLDLVPRVLAEEARGGEVRRHSARRREALQGVRDPAQNGLQLMGHRRDA